MMEGNSYSKMLYSVGYNKEKKQKTNLTYMLKCKWKKSFGTHAMDDKYQDKYSKLNVFHACVNSFN